MADELTLNCSMAYADSEDADESLSIVDLLVDVATKIYAKFKQSIGTSEEALKLGEVANLGWFLMINRDATNYVELKTGTGGTIIAKLLPGEFCFFRIGSGITAPYAIANSAACQCEIFLLSL